MENTNRIDIFVAEANRRTAEHFNTNYPRVVENGGMPTRVAEPAKKYVKVWSYRHGVKESIHSFINPVTGDVLMPAGLNKPAKHSRGNVFATDNGAGAFGYGGHINYMR